MYANGRGVPQDYVQAHMWFNLAEFHSSPGRVHDKAAQDRDAVAKRMTPAQVAEATERNISARTHCWIMRGRFAKIWISWALAERVCDVSDKRVLV